MGTREMLKRLRRWLQVKTGRVETPIDGDAPFWVVSVGFHLILLVLLAKIIITPDEPRNLKLVVDASEMIDLVELPPEVAFDEETMEELGAKDDDAFELANAEAPEVAIENEVSEDFDVPVMEELGEIVTKNDDFFADTAQVLTEVSQTGAAGYSVKGASGAVDRITEEILLSLQERKTTVVWMFDQSASLLRQREEIQNRFERIYNELGVLKASGDESFSKHDDRPLLTQVWAFGQTINPMLENETDDPELIQQSIGKIPRDETGVENVFSTVLKGVDVYRKYRRINRSTGERDRNIMFIVVSDEAGDDSARLDDSVEACTKYEIPVYVIGVPAPFGRDKTYVKWVDPDPKYDQTPQFAEVSQGPESLFPERLKLEFSGGDFEDLEMIDSGFGPFSLTRLCFETGGIYFAVHPNRRVGRVRRTETTAYSADLRYFFESGNMRKYRPDYVSRQEYIKRLKHNESRYVLVQAAEASVTGQLAAPQFRFPKLNEATFVNAISQAQRAAAVLEPKYGQLYGILKAGEKDREMEASPRWQAGYDLAFGRIMAGKVRAESYNAMLALAKTKLKFEDEKNNTWVLEPADSISTGSQAENMAEKARVYLERVIDQHPDTPWAMLAARELETPLGWEWKEDFTAPPTPRQPGANNNNNNNNPPRPNPRPQANAMPKQKRPPPKL